MVRRRWYRIAGAVVATALVAVPGAAFAAAPGVSMSLDGSTFSGVLAQPVFAAQPVLVPLDSVEGVFWVRNDGPEAARLTLLLDGASWDDAAFANALTVSAEVDGVQGTAVPLSSTSRCPVVASGAILEPGEAVAVTTTLTLGDLAAQEGQGASVGMNLSVGLTSAAGSATVPCAVEGERPGAVVTLVPRPVGGGAAPTEAAPVVPIADGEDTEPLDPFEQLAALLPNTLGSFDAWLVLIATASVPVGALAFLLIGRRRRATEDEVVP